MKMVCIDLDQTLVESNKAHALAFKKAFKEFGLEVPKAKEIIKHLQGDSAEVIIRKLFPKLKIKEAHEIAKTHNYYVVNETYKLAKPIVKNVNQVLKRIKKKFKLALISNCSKQEILALLKGAKINANIFDVIISKNEVSKPKPNPDEIFKAQNLIHSEAGYLVGDSVNDIKAARMAGIKSIAVLTGNLPKKEILNAKPDYVIKDISELPKILKEAA